MACVFVGYCLAPNLMGLTEFKKSFTEKYAGKTTDPDWQKMVRRAGCNVCHIPGKKKEEHNPYGQSLEDLIPGNAEERHKAAKSEGREKEEMAKILAELEEAFTKVEAMEASPGETYGDRIRAGKLPVDLPPKKK